jgi:hypothetical protein
MLLSFIDLYVFLSMCAFSDKTIDLIPNATQKRQVKSSIKILAQIEVGNEDFQTDKATTEELLFLMYGYVLSVSL